MLGRTAGLLNHIAGVQFFYPRMIDSVAKAFDVFEPGLDARVSLSIQTTLHNQHCALC